MDGTLAIILSLGTCFAGSGGYITYRCYCNPPQEERPVRLHRIGTSQEKVIQRQPTPPLEHVLKEAVNNIRNSNDSDTEIDIKIHVQSHKDKE